MPKEYFTIWSDYWIANGLKKPGDMFYTWQYDMRWACTKLRKRGIVQSAELSKRGKWNLR